MNVNEIEITEAQILAMLGVMAGSRFRASDIVAAGEAAGVEKGSVAVRAADRLIQRQRKKGAIRIIESGPYWQAVSA